MPVELHHGNILDLEVDAIVNAANTELQHAGSLAAAVAAEGGPTIQAESDAIGWCDLGSAVVTGAGNLRARHIIHVPTIDYTESRPGSLDDIEKGTRAALKLARGLSARSIAFPLLGAGVVGLNPGDVVRVMKVAMASCDDLQVTICAHWQGDWPSVQEAFEASS